MCVKKSRFTQDSYDTPDNARKSLLYKLLCKIRWYFYFYSFGIFVRSGLCAKRGGLDEAHQISYSMENIDLIERMGGKVHVRGLENLRALNGQPVILIGNHMSLLETAVFHAIIREYLDFTFVIKNTLYNVPFFKEIMKNLEAIPIGRANPRDDLRSVLEDGQKLLEKGRSIIIFPQATRSEEFNPDKFNSIGIKLAKKANVPVVPFALKTDFLGNGRYLKDLGPVRPEREIYFAFAPGRMVGDNGKKLQDEIIDFISTNLTEWKSKEQRNQR